MEIIINSKFSLFFLITVILNLFLSINNQFNEQTAIKAISCVSIVTTKFKKDEDQPNHYSPIVLACFMKITDDQAQRVLSGIEEGEIPLEPYEIDELTDVNKLKEYPQEEVERNAEILENTIKEFQKMDEDLDNLKENKYSEDEDYEKDDYDYDDYDFTGFNKKNKMSTKGFFGLIKKGVNELFSVAGGIWYAFFILIIIYLALLIMRKTNDLENNVRAKESERNEKEKKEKDGKEGKEEKEKESNGEKKKEKEKENDKDKEKAKTD